MCPRVHHYTYLQVLLSTLAFAHAQGVVHRDVKLDHLLVRTDNRGRGKYVLADWGFATHAQGRELTYECGTAGP